MTFTYDITASPFANKDVVRLLIGDADADTYVFEDEEITTFLTMEGTALGAAATALRSYAASRSRQAVMLQLPGVNITKTEIGKQARELADTYEQKDDEAAVPLTANTFTQTQTWLDAVRGRHTLDFDAPTSE